MYHVSAQGVDEGMLNVHYYLTVLGCVDIEWYNPGSGGDNGVRLHKY